MTIRTKLLIFIPLLVLLINLVTFFLFQSGKMVQQSYNQMIDRILLYNQSSKIVDNNLSTLYSYLLNPDDSNKERYDHSRVELQDLRLLLQEKSNVSISSSTITSYVHLLDTFWSSSKTLSLQLLPKDRRCRSLNTRMRKGQQASYKRTASSWLNWS